MSGSDRLEAFLYHRGLSRREFGRKLGVGEGVVSRWITGRRIPDRVSAVLIQKHTNGKVPVSCWGSPTRRAA